MLAPAVRKTTRLNKQVHTQLQCAPPAHKVEMSFMYNQQWLSNHQAAARLQSWPIATATADSSVTAKHMLRFMPCRQHATTPQPPCYPAMHASSAALLQPLCRPAATNPPSPCNSPSGFLLQLACLPLQLLRLPATVPSLFQLYLLCPLLQLLT